ncbi:MAG: YqgE/AlgH family protein [Bacteroidales bacterium]|nr:YqgE/AlgH family protein [Bacteroidales bacterium]
MLISEPHLNDYYFSRSVILLADHNPDGSFGLIVNKPLPKRFSEVVNGFPRFDAPVFLGGPVRTDALFYIHTLGDIIEGSSQILDGLSWGGNLEQIRGMMHDNILLPSQIRFFVGYSGWSPKQLEQELEQHSWIVSRSTTEEILADDPSDLWVRYLRSLGDEYAIWANYPKDPILN